MVLLLSFCNILFVIIVMLALGAKIECRKIRAVVNLEQKVNNEKTSLAEEKKLWGRDLQMSIPIDKKSQKIRRSAQSDISMV